MPSSHLILCHPLLLLSPISPSIRVFSNESALSMRWPKYWSFNFSIIPSKEIAGLISFRMDWLDLQSKGLSRVFSNSTVQKHFELILQLMENSATQQASKTHLALEMLANGQLHTEPSSEDSDLVPSLAVGGDGISSLQDQASPCLARRTLRTLRALHGSRTRRRW